MSDVLYLVGWNQAVAVVFGLGVWLLCHTRWLSRRPAVCHALWLLVLLQMLMPPIYYKTVADAARVPLEWAKTGILTNSATANVPRDTCSSGAVPREIVPQLASAHSGCAEPVVPSGWWPWLSTNSPALLLGGSLLVTGAVWLIAGRKFYQVRRLLGRSEVETGRVADTMSDVAERFSARKPRRLLVVEAPITPMLWAAPGSSAVVLPRQLAETIDEGALRNILAHELAHYARRDHWSNLFAFVVTTLFWWNPMAWFARRQLAAAAEACCDAMALERLRGSRKTYAATLLVVVDSLRPTPAMRSAFALPFGESRSLRRRVELIAEENVSGRMSRRGWAVLAVAFVLLTLAITPLVGAKRVSSNPYSFSTKVSAMCCPTTKKN